MEQSTHSAAGTAAPSLSADAVFRQYATMVYRLAYLRTRSRADADDVLQEVFLRYLKSAPIFESETHRKAWLIRVTLNRTGSLLTAPWRKRTVPLTAPVSSMECTCSAEDTDVYAAVAALPQAYRTVIHLFYCEDMTTAQIAALLGVKEAAVRTRLSRARGMLRDRLKEEIEVV